MKILWLTWKDKAHPLAGGAEVVSSEIARRLAADGHEVRFVVGGFPGAKQKVTTNGYTIIRTGGRYSVYAQAYRYYKRHLKGWADVVIEEVNTIPFFSRFYAREPRLLLFHQLCRQIWFHQMPLPLSAVGYLGEAMYLRLLGRKPTITVSESTKRDLMRYGFRESHIHLISEGIEFEPMASLDATEKFSQPTLLSFGSLRAMKRTLDQIKAFEIAKQEIPSLRLKIAGGTEGKYGQKCLNYIAASPYARDIEYLGRVSQAEKIALMQKTHLFLATSVKEGWCIVVTEAASQGTPAVVYNVDGLRDSVRHNQTGLVVSPTPRALATGIIAALQNAETYANLRTQAWQWSRDINFTQSYADFKRVLEVAI